MGDGADGYGIFRQTISSCLPAGSQLPTPIPSASILHHSNREKLLRHQEGKCLSVVLLLDAMVPWKMEARLAETVWVVLLGWVSSCLTVAGDVARALRSSDLSV
ncbi:uncharacterized protein [Aegilops tauschii subsp. strangulata]|uniref:uncharacterized protein n=1 Tax=Aegilops tauschii subsp. strangulata TaxID=200361 RepID=UPI000989A9C9|nr:uncharacterized protein LOC109731615 [Aegilops tauschii subsp. strangulata]XP_044418674.1 uncharacterized protein LOC123143759 [Triticum aestivum]